MAQASFPEPKSLKLLEIGDGMDHIQKKYTLENPHPGYGTDPNIINEYGHTLYPKWIDSKIEGKRIVVNSPMEEAQHTEVKEEKKEEKKVKKEVKEEPEAPDGWK
jgi:hypothetical protein